MVIAVGIDEAKANKLSPKAESYANVNTTGGRSQMRFFGFRDNPDMPYAQFSQQKPGRISGAHYHVVDQFQVVVDGKCTFGRHPMAPYGVHFSRAYTPYGPLVADAQTGFSFLAMRAHGDPGAEHLPKALDKLKQVPNRHPWQISRQIAFPASEPGTRSADVMLQADPDIKNEHGLATYTLRMKPNVKTYAPDPSSGDGQYLVVTKGSVLQNNKEHRALALVFIAPNEGPFQICAGPQGLDALVLNFPRPLTKISDAPKSTLTTTGFKTWQCALCAFVYDEAAGLPEESIAPGTRWQDVPESWNCPDCSASKAEFQMFELQNY